MSETAIFCWGMLAGAGLTLLALWVALELDYRRTERKKVATVPWYVVDEAPQTEPMTDDECCASFKKERSDGL